VDLQIGARYIASIPGEGEIEVTLLSPAGGESIAEGGGESLYIPRWLVRRGDGSVLKVEEPALKPLDSKPT
jgi:hypothetical protein